MIDAKVYIPGLELRSLNRDLRGTSIGSRMAAAATAKGQRTGVATMCWTKFGVPPRGKNNEPVPLVITITRVGPRELDTDNLAGSAKHVRDGISDWLGINDRDKRLRWDYAQEKRGAKEYGVQVRVQTWIQTAEERLACDKAYQDLAKKAQKLKEALAKLEPGTSEARIVAAGMRWSRAVEARDQREREVRWLAEGQAA